MPANLPIDLREEALLLLENRGALLQAAVELSRAMASAGIEGAVIGGVAVVLHGYVRTTRDVNLFVPGPDEPMGDLLQSLGFAPDRSRREFRRDGLPIHLVTIDQIVQAPREVVELQGITTVSLADLVAMKLRSGTRHLVRAIDLADVIGLIRHRGLSAGFASQLPKELRAAFRRLVKAVEEDGGGRG